VGAPGGAGDRYGHADYQPRSANEMFGSANDKSETPRSTGEKRGSTLNHIRAVREKQHLSECCW